MTINASNIDGTTTKDVSVEVVETMPYVVKFPTPSYLANISEGTLLPTVLFSCVRCWSISTIPVLSGVLDGQVMEGEVERMFKFTPSAPGEYTVL